MRGPHHSVLKAVGPVRSRCSGASAEPRGEQGVEPHRGPSHGWNISRDAALLSSAPARREGVSGQLGTHVGSLLHCR